MCRMQHACSFHAPHVLDVFVYLRLPSFTFVAFVAFVAFVSQMMMIKAYMKTAAGKTRSFKALQNQAPVTLEGFLTGFRSAMFHIPAADGRSE